MHGNKFWIERVFNLSMGINLGLSEYLTYPREEENKDKFWIGLSEYYLLNNLFGEIEKKIHNTFFWSDVCSGVIDSSRKREFLELNVLIII